MLQWRKKYTRPLRCGQPRPRAFFLLGIAGCAILAAVLVPNLAEGQVRTWAYSADAEETFGNALEAYQQGRFDETINHLRQLAEFPLNQRSSAGQFLLGKSLYRLGALPKPLTRPWSCSAGFPSAAICPMPVC